jgi:hypothetical protein
MRLQDINTSTPAEAVGCEASSIGDIQAFEHADHEQHQLSRRLHEEVARRPNFRKNLNPRVGAQKWVSHACAPSPQGLQLGFALPAYRSENYPAIGAFETHCGCLGNQF